ncbi:helix-turn-helix transcriptional regulator [Methylomarinum sp. Ch1-1]|uniref:Helix-turn-helix transcriptional regulator n=1 Tax=Methylomarinum roseum TaxID=3067653 RepID=A0AAU7NWR5_9GAMM|nr:helix-turn-helix transcriptional regulator [Methylomarinum sp. Ch1-1]MDP4522518.1 helix-turn-helix transcriptional regulator [Methylomarinum sp. Ch1-1]
MTNNVTNSDIGTRLKTRRKKLGMSQQELADRSGVGRSTIAKIEKGPTTQPTETYLKLLAKALDVSPAWLQYGVEFDDEVYEAAIILQELPEEKRKAVINMIKVISQS